MNAWVFDIDGVITDPATKIADEKILKHIPILLEKGYFVALNTGRSFTWTEEKILTPLIKNVQDLSMLKNMFIVCEFGNVLASFHNESFKKRILDDPLPEDLQKKVISIASEFAESLSFDDSKETMISFEMHDGFEVEKFEPIIKSLEEKINNILQTDYVDLNLRVETNQIALDILYEDAGKHLGAERIEDFMLEHSIKPKVIFMLGDNPSDSQMAEELQGAYPVRFVYVGDEKKLNRDNLTCDVIFTKSKYTLGTLEFLEKQG